MSNIISYETFIKIKNRKLAEKTTQPNIENEMSYADIDTVDVLDHIINTSSNYKNT